MRSMLFGVLAALLAVLAVALLVTNAQSTEPVELVVGTLEQILA